MILDTVLGSESQEAYDYIFISLTDEPTVKFKFRFTSRTMVSGPACFDPLYRSWFRVLGAHDYIFISPSDETTVKDKFKVMSRTMISGPACFGVKPQSGSQLILKKGQCARKYKGSLLPLSL
jgi:hypothetical protein